MQSFPEQNATLQRLKHVIDELTLSPNSYSRERMVDDLNKNYIGSASLETWRTAVQYASTRSDTMNEEIEQLHSRLDEIAGFRGQDIHADQFVYDEKPTEWLYDATGKELAEMLVGLIVKRRDKRVEMENLADDVMAYGEVDS